MKLFLLNYKILGTRNKGQTKLGKKSESKIMRIVIRYGIHYI